jgi:hypothetical protein
MRFRDYFWILFAAVVLTWVYFGGMLQKVGFSPTSEEIDRDDAKRVSTVLLSAKDWAEFHISPDARSIRLITNGALENTELPQKNQSDPREGWRYSIEYQLLDADGELIGQHTYESRTRVRQLVDKDQGTLINPLMFAKTDRVATQTRFVQIPIVVAGTSDANLRPAMIRVRAADSDPQIVEIVARVRTKHQRPHFDQPSTWRQIPASSRRKLARYCVFDQKFLTKSERASLLRWQWLKAPTLNKVKLRHLYFIGEVDDQEASEYVPCGANTISAARKITLPLPERIGNFKLSAERLNLSESNPHPIYFTIRLFPSDQSEPLIWEETLAENKAEFTFPVSGGLLEFESTSAATWSATWTHNQPDAPPVQIHDAEVAFGQSAEITSNNGNLRVYLADNVPVSYRVSHFQTQPTPFRITCRLAFGDAFTSDQVQSNMQNRKGSFERWDELKFLNWAWLNDDDQIIEQGEIGIQPTISAYDQLWKSGETNLVSEFKRYYFSIPPEATKIQFHSNSVPFLINASVRPNHLPVVTRLPEDHHPFERQFKPYRKWYNLHPDENLRLISDNRSFLISTQTRPSDTQDEDTIGKREFQWQRYEPKGQWIGRQLLAPATMESVVTEASRGSSFYEMNNGETYSVQDYGMSIDAQYRLIYVAPASTQSVLIVSQDGKIVQREKLNSARGIIRLKLDPFNAASNITLQGPPEIRMFLSGGDVVGAKRYLKRTASKLENGKLEFEHVKTTPLDEVLTLLIYRKSSGEQRCKFSVKIEAENQIQMKKSGPVESLTSLHQIYDLKSSAQQQNAILIGTDAELDVQHRCFIRLGADLPPGRYTIKTQRIDQQEDGFVLLYQSIAINEPTE